MQLLIKARLSSQLSDDRCCRDDGNWLGTPSLGRLLKPLSDLTSELQPSQRDGKNSLLCSGVLHCCFTLAVHTIFYNGEGSVGIRFNIRLLV